MERESDYVVITAAKTLIGKVKTFHGSDAVTILSALELIVETAIAPSGQIARRFTPIPWGDLVDDGTPIRVDIRGAIVMRFDEMGNADRATYEEFVRRGEELRKQARAHKSGIKVAQDIPKIKLSS